MFKKNTADNIKTNLSGSNELLTLTVSSSRALVIQILLVNGLAHKQGPLPISYVHECSRVSITVRPGSISTTWQKQIDSTEPQTISQERNREVQTILNVLKAPSNSELARKGKFLLTKGGINEAKTQTHWLRAQSFCIAKSWRVQGGKPSST